MMHRLLFRVVLAVLLTGLCLCSALDYRLPRSPPDEDAACPLPVQPPAVPPQVTLLLGNTGCGKTTLARYLTANDKDLVAVRENDEFLIQGEGIGSSITSMTQVPQVMTDAETGEHFVDFPGFEDTRGPCAELSSAFLLRRVTERVRLVRVMLLTPHFAVRRGQDRGGLVSMLLHAARLIKDPAKLKHSVALIVTKVDAAQRALQTVQGGVARFLRDDVRPFLEQQKNATDVHRRAVTLVDIFLAGNNHGRYEHIGVFRTPEVEGKLTDSMAMEQGRAALRHLVRVQLRAATVRPEDFGYTISERTKLYAVVRAQSLRDAVSDNMKALGRDAVRQALLATLEFARAERLEASAALLRSLTHRVAGTNDTRDLALRLATAAEAAPRPLLPLLPLRIISETVAVLSDIDVLQVAFEAPLVDAKALSQWTQSLGQASDFVSARLDWSRFLVSLYDRLAKYDLQGQLSRSVVANLSHWADGVTADKLDLFLDGVNDLGVAPSAQMRFRPDFAPLADLNKLLALTLRNTTEVQCLPSGRVVVRGEFVVLAEVLPPRCRCPGALTAVDVYAINTVFLDGDVQMPGGHVVVVAPRWEVVGAARIILNGQPGSPFDKPGAASAGQRGVNGQPGSSGAPGGSFLGVGALFVGDLHVSVNGGPGGPGQGGGDGGPALPDRSSGGDGGDGGVGGLGGRPGKALLINVAVNNKKTAILALAENGTLINVANINTTITSTAQHVHAEDGPRGAAGRGGEGGKRVGRRKRDPALLILLLLGLGLGLAAVGANSGAARGRDGAVTAGLRDPVDARTAAWDHVPQQVQHYLRQHLDHPYQRTALFLQQLEHSEQFQLLGNGQ